MDWSRAVTAAEPCGSDPPARGEPRVTGADACAPETRRMAGSEDLAITGLLICDFPARAQTETLLALGSTPRATRVTGPLAVATALSEPALVASADFRSCSR